MFAAAGIVVTEISTPMSAPDFAVESESMPAAPAQNGDEEREEVRARDHVRERVVGLA